jgi:hypothetical protein
MASKKKNAKTPTPKPAKTAPTAQPAPAQPVPASQRTQAVSPAAANAGDKPLSALAAAARILSETDQALTCPELIAAMAAQGYWTSPAGKTPAATLYAAILREIKTKKDQARFRKSERGKFTRA